MSARRQHAPSAGRLPDGWSTPETRQIIEKMMAVCETRDREGAVAALERLSAKAAPADAPLTHVARPRFDPARGAVGPAVHADADADAPARPKPEPSTEPVEAATAETAERTVGAGSRLPSVPARAVQAPQGPREPASAFGARAATCGASNPNASTSTRADDADARVLELMARASLREEPTSQPEPALEPALASEPEPEPEPVKTDAAVVQALTDALDAVPATGIVPKFEDKPPPYAQIDTSQQPEFESEVARKPELALLVGRVPKSTGPDTYRSEALIEGFTYSLPSSAAVKETEVSKTRRFEALKAANANRETQNAANTERWCSDATSENLWKLIGELVQLYDGRTEARANAAAEPAAPAKTGETNDVAMTGYAFDYDKVLQVGAELRAKREAKFAVMEGMNEALHAMSSASIVTKQNVPESALRHTPEQAFIHALVGIVYKAHADPARPQRTDGLGFDSLHEVTQRTADELHDYIDSPFDEKDLAKLQVHFDDALKGNLGLSEDELNDGTHGYGYCVDNYAYINAGLTASTLTPQKEQQALADETAQYLYMLQVYERIVPPSGGASAVKVLSKSVLADAAKAAGEAGEADNVAKAATADPVAPSGGVDMDVEFDDNANREDMDVEVARESRAAWRQNLDALMEGYESHLHESMYSKGLIGAPKYTELRSGLDEAMPSETTAASTEYAFDVALLRESFGTPLPESELRANEAAARFDDAIKAKLAAVETELLVPDVLKATKRFLAAEQPMAHEPASAGDLLPLQPTSLVPPMSFPGIRQALLDAMGEENQMVGLGFEEDDWDDLTEEAQRGIAEVVVDFGLQSFLGYANRGRRNWDKSLENTWLRRQGDDPDAESFSADVATKHFPPWRLAQKLDAAMQEKLPALAQDWQGLPEFVDEFTFGLQTWLNCVIEGSGYMQRIAEAVNANQVSRETYNELHLGCVRVTAAFRESVAAAHGLANPSADAAYRILVPRSDTGEMPTYGDGITDDTQNKHRILGGLAQLSQQLPQETLSGSQKRPAPGESSQNAPDTTRRRRNRRIMPPSPEEQAQLLENKKRPAPADSDGDGNGGDPKRSKMWDAIRDTFTQRAAFGMVNLLEHLF